jgi:polyhydroxybutyrate depolymerase
VLSARIHGKEYHDLGSPELMLVLNLMRLYLERYGLPILIGLIMSLITSCGDTPPSSSRMSTASTQLHTSASMSGQLRWLRVNQQWRRYLIYVPATLPAAENHPLILVFHNFTGTGLGMQFLTQFNALADQENFVVVYPYGELRRWNDATTSTDEGLRVDDIGFVTTLLETLTDTYAIDATRVYAVGYSDGAFFSARLACELSEQITAIGLVAGSMAARIANNCRPQRPIPVIQLRGTEDRIVPSEGFPGYLSTEAVTQTWVEINGCDPVPGVREIPDKVDDQTSVTQIVYSHCLQGTEVQLFQISGGGHTWPGSEGLQLERILGRTSQELDGTTQIWTFLQAYSLP